MHVDILKALKRTAVTIASQTHFMFVPLIISYEIYTSKNLKIIKGSLYKS